MTVTPPSNVHAGGPRLPRKRFHDLPAFARAVRRDPVAAQYRRRIEQRRSLGAFGGREHLRSLDAVRVCEPLPSLQLLDALGRGCEFEAADAVPDLLAVEIERVVERNGVLSDPAHRAGPVGLEDDPRRVRGGAAGGEQRALIDHEHVGLAEVGEVIGGRDADDAGADDHGLGARGQISHDRDDA